MIHDIANDHYAFAHGLDCAANKDSTKIVQHYQQAIELDPTNVQYHASYICYLLTKARQFAAEDAWEKAAELHSNQYDVLHFPVARLALHCTQLEFAETVLMGIPLADRTGDLLILWNELQVCGVVEKVWWWTGGELPQHHAEGYLDLPSIYPDPSRYLRE